jgi:hypothetical protein
MPTFFGQDVVWFQLDRRDSRGRGLDSTPSGWNRAAIEYGDSGPNAGRNDGSGRAGRMTVQQAGMTGQGGAKDLNWSIRGAGDGAGGGGKVREVEAVRAVSGSFAQLRVTAKAGVAARRGWMTAKAGVAERRGWMAARWAWMTAKAGMDGGRSGAGTFRWTSRAFCWTLRRAHDSWAIAR